MQKGVLITGISGGLGQGLYEAFADSDYFVIGIDRVPSRIPRGARYQELTLDVVDLLGSESLRTEVVNEVDKLLSTYDLELNCLVNNAAIQLLGGIDQLSMEDFDLSLRTNLQVPLQLTLLFKDHLARTSGSVINLDSIHSRLTKPGFISYATSKSALSGLTRALAIDLSGRIRVNSIQPAAIRTKMLLAGFEGRESELAQLESFHPSGRVGEPREVGNLAVFLASDKCKFINGANVYVDGGIGARLHDPI